MIINYEAHGRTPDEIEQDAIRIGTDFYGDTEWIYVLGDTIPDGTEITAAPLDGAISTSVRTWAATVTAGPYEEMRRQGHAE